MSVTRFKNGISTAGSTTALAQWGLPDPTKYITYFNDFHIYTVGDWTLTTTEAGAGDATEAITGENGGVLLITNDAADDDRDFFQLAAETFKFIAGKKLWFKARFKVSDATQSDFVMGLQITDTTPLDVTDGVFFQKDDGDAFLDFRVEKNNTATAATAIHTMVDATYVTVGFYYDGGTVGSTGNGTIAYYVDDVCKGTSVCTNLVDDEELTVSFGIQNGAAAAKTMSVDYIFVSTER
jgi:hypothetical protein